MKFRSLFIFLFILSPVYLFSQSINKKLDQYLVDYYINKDVPSISAGIIHNGEIVWLGAQGFADLENNVPATDKSVYRMASISKVITAVAVMQLVEQGKIKLDEDARKYIPYFPAKRWKFSVRQLLTHTAGIRNYRSTGEFESKEYFQSTKEAINYLAKDSLEYEPGTRYHYTTLSYNLIAAIIESVSGLSFSDYLKKNIFEPAGMNSTYPDFQRNIIPFRTKGYDRNKYRKLQNAALADLSIKIPGGGLLSNAEDLLKFSESFLNGKLIKLTILDSMMMPTKLRNGNNINYGLGIALGSDESGRKYITHSGTGTGFSSLLVIFPQEKTAVVHLINIRDRNLDEPAFEIASLFFGKEIEKPTKSIANYLFSITLSSNIDSSINTYKEIQNDTTNSFNISKEELITFGYDLISIQRYTDAIKYFKFLTIEFPDYAEAFIGLGDSYYKDGNQGLSLKNFRQAVKLQPSNKYAKDMIKKLTGT